MTDTVSVRTICGTVVMIMSYDRGRSVVEMTLSEAKAIRERLDKAILEIESGSTFNDGLTSLLARYR